MTIRHSKHTYEYTQKFCSLLYELKKPLQNFMKRGMELYILTQSKIVVAITILYVVSTGNVA